MKMKKKILMLSDSPVTNTGYGTVTLNVLNGLSDEYEVHVLEHNRFGQTVLPGTKLEDGIELKFYQHGAGKDSYSMDKIKYLIDKYDIDVFGILLDTFMTFQAGFLNVDTSPAKTFFYYPSDGGGTLPYGCDSILRKVDMPIAMARFGQRQTEKVHGIKSKYIQHGYDKNVYYQLDEEGKLKAKEKFGLLNKFVVGVVGRNQGRKMHDRALKAFKLFCVDKPDAVLFMHCDPYDKAASTNLIELIQRYKLENRVLFTGTSFHNPFTYEQMREMYNVMDVYFSSTSGEGFGIPTIEAMACGIPQVMPDYTTSRELVLEDDIETGLLIKLVGEEEWTPDPHCDEILDGTVTGSWNVERGLMSVKHASEQLTTLYNDFKGERALYNKFVENSVKKALKYYTWQDTVVPKFKEAIKELLEK